MGIDLCLWRLRVGSFNSLRHHNNSAPLRAQKPTNTSFSKRKTRRHDILHVLFLLLLCLTWFSSFTYATSTTNSNGALPQLFNISHNNTNVTPETTASKCMYYPSAYHLLLCMDVERNPGPQRVSGLPPTTIELFNKVKRNKLKLVRYQNHLINFTTYLNGNLIPKGLLPKCTPAIHSNNPLFWSQWKQNLSHLAKTQLQLLIEETQNQITALKTIFNEQFKALQTAVNDHATYILLSDLIDNMAFNLRNNLDLRRTTKLKCILPSDTRQDTPSHPATSNSLPINNRENNSQTNIIEAEHDATSINPDVHTTNTGNTATRILTSTNQNKKNRRTRSNNSSNPPEEQKETVINLSTAQLSNTEIKLLSRGLTFVPTPKRINWSEIQADINDFARRLRLKEFFHQNNKTDSTNPSDEVKRFRCKGTWTPPNGRDAALDAFINAIENDIMTCKPTPIRNNLSRKECKALTTLRKRTDIKPADKGSGTVIMDHSWYVNECDRQLNDTKYYQKQSSDLTNKVQERVKEYTTRLHRDNLIDYETLKYLSSNSEPKAGRFYILPKIHKQGNPGRPIISSNGHPTE